MFKYIAIPVLGMFFGSAALSAAPETSTTSAKTAAANIGVKKFAKGGVPSAPPLMPLSDEHRDLATRIIAGPVSCEKGASVHLKPHAASEGRFVLTHGQQKFVMEPTLTTTGALRLEDPLTGVVWLQLANKSMLLNQRLGKRLADGCMTPDQAAIALAMETGAVPGLLDSPNGEPARVAK